MVPRSGLVVDADNVCFENIDFVWDHRSEIVDASPEQAALIHLRTGEAEFRGCSFQASKTVATPPVTIRWTHPTEASLSELSLPSGQVRLRDCVLNRVNVGIDCQTVGALTLQLTNTLHLGSGPVVRLDHCPRADEPIRIALGQTTLRGTGPLLECPCPSEDAQPGELAVQADRCAFVPRPGAPLIRLTGPNLSAQFVRKMRWTGQGSLVSPNVVIAAWQAPDGRQRAIKDSAVSIDGLVRSKVEFAGGQQSVAAVNQIVRWQAPLRSADPPGIDPTRLATADRDTPPTKGSLPASTQTLLRRDHLSADRPNNS
jgi:hypothetical protein